MKHKMVIVMRHDLHMRMGKAVAQGGHAAMMFIIRRMMNGGEPSEAEIEWLFESHMAKICVRVDSLDELLKIEQEARTAGLVVERVLDAGFTEFKEPTITCIALGPDLSEKIDKITGGLKLL